MELATQQKSNTYPIFNSEAVKLFEILMIVFHYDRYALF